MSDTDTDADADAAASTPPQRFLMIVVGSPFDAAHLLEQAGMDVVRLAVTSAEILAVETDEDGT